MDQKAFFSLWMPRRKSPIFKLPVLIQFQVAADTPTPPAPPWSMPHLLDDKKSRISPLLSDKKAGPPVCRLTTKRLLSDVKRSGIPLMSDRK